MTWHGRGMLWHGRGMVWHDTACLGGVLDGMVGV